MKLINKFIEVIFVGNVDMNKLVEIANEMLYNFHSAW